jgi:hypothetical protein
MSINYAAAALHANFWRQEIIPHLRHISPPTTFSDYLAAYYHTQTPDKTYGLPDPHIYSLEFIKRHKEKLITFQYNSPEDVKNGSAILSCVNQFSKSLHGMVNLSLWHDESEGKSDGYVTVFFVYEKLEEVLAFIDDNLDIVKKEGNEKPVGFNSRIQPPIC